MENKYRTPRIDSQNVVTFTCSDGAVDTIVELLNELHALGNMGASRDVRISWDGDGNHQLSNISINGMSESAWEDERDRLNPNWLTDLYVRVYCLKY